MRFSSPSRNATSTPASCTKACSVWTDLACNSPWPSLPTVDCKLSASIIAALLTFSSSVARPDTTWRPMFLKCSSESLVTSWTRSSDLMLDMLLSSLAARTALMPSVRIIS
nr:hypothetical protein Iba_chr11bCG1670 [Ipomoea batatas]GMD53224.1 hypothetical protein Iba_chr11cCG0620 [Ipomoea batatas]GMD54902.1 hypothetical protein Iba_chr11dCG2820 [Ipomoea batatas]GMD58024.1 hypothetical protein Iba_chr11fCG1610 [Ipomoea batatas]